MCISKRQKRKWRRTLSWPWFSHWALRKPPARNSHKSESLKAFQTQLLWRLGAQISPDKSHPRTAFLLHSNKFTFSPTSRHSHPHSPRSLKMCSKPKFIFSWNSAQVKLFIYQPLMSERAVTIAQFIEEGQGYLMLPTIFSHNWFFPHNDRHQPFMSPTACVPRARGAKKNP